MEGDWVFRTVVSILGCGGIGVCILGYMTGIVVGCCGGFSVLAWVGAGVGMGFTLGYYAVGFVESSGRGKILGVCVGSGSAVPRFRIWAVLM